MVCGLKWQSRADLILDCISLHQSPKILAFHFGLTEASGDLEEQDAGSLDKTFGNIYMYNNKKKKKRKEKTTYPFGNTVQTMNWRANNGNPEQ